MPTADEILSDIAPELSSVETGRRERILALADARTASGLYPDDVRVLAVAYLAAHMLSASGSATVTGAVVSKTVGPLSISYASPDASEFGLTSYGRELLALQKSYVFGPRTRIDL